MLRKVDRLVRVVAVSFLCFLLVVIMLYRRVITFGALIVLWDADYGPAAHRTNLGLEEPAPKALLVEDMLAVGDLHQGLLGGELKLFQADAAIVVFGVLCIVHIGLQQSHVSLHDGLSLNFVQFIVLIVIRSIEMLVHHDANDREAEEGHH